MKSHCYCLLLTALGLLHSIKLGVSFGFVLSLFMLAAVIREEGTMQAMRKVEGVAIGSLIRSRRRSLREEFRLQKIKAECRPNQGYLGKGLPISIASIVCMH